MRPHSSELKDYVRGLVRQPADLSKTKQQYLRKYSGVKNLLQLWRLNGGVIVKLVGSTRFKCLLCDSRVGQLESHHDVSKIIQHIGGKIHYEVRTRAGREVGIACLQAAHPSHARHVVLCRST